MPEATGNSDATPGDRGPRSVHLLVRLELADKPPREFSYEFKQNVISLGRDPSNDIQIPLTTVSRNHARIFFERGDYFLEDLGSTHGTEHNGERMQRGEKRLLRDGDRVGVPRFTIVFKTTLGAALDRRPGEKTEQLARRMVEAVLSSLDGADADVPALRIMNGPDEGKRLEIREAQAEITLGRSPDCDLMLDDQNVSRRHCLIKRSWHGFTAQDLGSRNGVLVNGVRIEGARMIKDGDILQVGGIKLVFIDPPSRMLEQIGGADAETVDFGAVAQASAADEARGDDADRAEDAEDEDAGDAEVEDAGFDGDMDVEPEEGESSRESAPEEPNEEILAARREFEALQKRGVAIEVVILVAGGALLVVALVFIALFLI